ncbi:6904_t:CDS:2, partial [Ambispora gerdemannii]
MFGLNKFQPQRTLTQEPSIFLRLRVTVAFSIISLWIIYACFLLVQIITDRPVIDVDTYTDCGREDGALYIISGGGEEPKTIYCYLFSGNGTLFYGNTTGGIWKIGIFYTMIDAGLSNSTINEVANIVAQLYDPNSNTWKHNIKMRNKLEEAVYKDTKLQGSNFAGLKNYSTIVKFKQNTYRSISQRDIKSYFGLSATYEETIILPSTVTYYPLKENAEFVGKKFSGFISMNVESYIHEVYTERRLRTVLNSLGVAGGIIGFFAAFYCFLFGDKKIKPWGFVHRIFSSQLEKSTDDKLTSSLLSEYNDKQVKNHERRLMYLEGLISDYIINTCSLEKVKKKLIDEENLYEKSDGCFLEIPTSDQELFGNSTAYKELIQNFKIANRYKP